MELGASRQTWRIASQSTPGFRANDAHWLEILGAGCIHKFHDGSTSASSALHVDMWADMDSFPIVFILSSCKRAN